MSDRKLKQSLDLLNIFKQLNRQHYCLIKMPPEFPDFNVGSDLDIYCYDISAVSRIILGELNKIIDCKEYCIEIKEELNQVHIDLIYGKEIVVRFDLYASLPAYKNIIIKSSYFVHVLENAMLVEIEDIQIKIPSKIDDSLIRYIEYQEFYAQRPDKIKHIHYIESYLKNNDVNLEDFFEKLHYFTALPNVSVERKVSSNYMVRYVVTNGRKAYRYTQSHGFSATFKRIFEKLKK